jgi:hypothetical protein
MDSFEGHKTDAIKYCTQCDNTDLAVKAHADDQYNNTLDKKFDPVSFKRNRKIRKIFR